MPSIDIYEAVAAIMRPLPDRDPFMAANRRLSGQDREFAFEEALEQAHRDRAAFLAELRMAEEAAHETDQEYDPLLATIDACQTAMAAAEYRMRLLVAYGREFVRPQPYQLKDLAGAARMSVSGVRIAYDEDEVHDVIELTGAKPRRPWPLESE